MQSNRPVKLIASCGALVFWPWRTKAIAGRLREAIAAAERELDGKGRVVVRYSGTEALARVMIEAESKEQMDRLAESIVGSIRSALGA